MKIFLIILMLFAVAQAQVLPGTQAVISRPSVSGGGNVADTIASWNMSRTAKTCSGYGNLAGNVGPAGGSVRTSTVMGITISTVNVNNWVNNSGNTSYDAFGTQSGVFFTGCNSTTNAVMYNQYVNLAAYNSSLPQFRISGLNPNNLYTFKASGSVNSGSNSGRLTGFRLDDDNGRSSELSYNPGGTSGVNTSSGVTFTNVKPKSDGTIDVYFYYAGTTQPAVVGAISIEEQ